MNIYLRFKNSCRKLKAEFCKIFLIFLILIHSGCSRKIEGSDSPVFFGDVIFTDSFSPSAYEFPLSRKVIIAEDTDIGIIIPEDTADPRTRGIYSLVNNFFEQLYAGKNLSLFFSNAVFNSYRLRYNNLKPSGTYKLRVSRPDDTASSFRIKYKLMMKDKNIIGEFELTAKDDSYIITDFEYRPFDEIFSIERE